MSRKSDESDIRRYWGHSILATLLVAVLPSIVALRLEAAGLIESAFASSLLAIAGSALAATVGATLWMRGQGSSDILFSELMIWGYIRRLILEKRVLESTKLLAGAGRKAGWHASRPTFQVQTLQKLAAALEARDPYTHGHSRRVARLATMIAKQMGLPAKRVQLVRTAAAVHDVGKLYVPSGVINKRGRLTDAEFATIKLHSSKGAELVAGTANKELAAIVRHHHERYDGSGYPDGIAGVNIPLGARIIAVADTFDAITSTRSYRPASSHRFALSVLKKEAGRQLDPDAVQAFLAYYTGRRSLLRWVVLLTGPHRVLGQAMGWFQGAAASTASNAATLGTAALVSGTVLVGGASLAPALAAHFEPTSKRAGVEMAEGRFHHGQLPPGLARKGRLPYGLAKRDELPPGLAKDKGKPKHAKNGKDGKAATGRTHHPKDHARGSAASTRGKKRAAEARSTKSVDKDREPSKVKEAKDDKTTSDTENGNDGSDDGSSNAGSGSSGGSGGKASGQGSNSGSGSSGDNATDDQGDDEQ